ncbi:MAG TPA: hypothetical protein VMT88_08170 [Actinomycetes bacterium]|nr:hypothetical protein [Actinomycetes bacterium]
MSAIETSEGIPAESSGRGSPVNDNEDFRPRLLSQPAAWCALAAVSLFAGAVLAWLRVDAALGAGRAWTAGIDLRVVTVLAVAALCLALLTRGASRWLLVSGLLTCTGLVQFAIPIMDSRRTGSSVAWADYYLHGGSTLDDPLVPEGWSVLVVTSMLLVMTVLVWLWSWLNRETSTTHDRPKKLTMNPALWFAATGFVVVVSVVAGVLTMLAENDEMEREVAFTGFTAVTICVLVSVVTAMVARGLPWLWLAALGAFGSLGLMFGPIDYWLTHMYHGWRGWADFVPRLLVVEGLVAVLLGGIFFVVAVTTLVVAQRRARRALLDEPELVWAATR